MKMRTLTALSVVLTVTLGGCQSSPEGETADLILKDANVITVDPDRPQAEAIAIQGDLILAVGTNDEVDAFVGDTTRVLSLNGATVVPGLIDAHMHFPLLGKRTKQLFLDETRTPEEAVAMSARRWRKALPASG